MVMTLCTKIDNMGNKPKNSNKPTCSFCHKKGHDASRCFKKKKCFNCQKTGHISKFCPENKSETGAIRDDVKPAPRTIIKINTCGKTVDFLYGTGSQVTIMKRQDFEKLPNKPPLQKVERSGTAVDGTPFKFDGITYLNLSFPSSDSNRHRQYTLEYEPILISSNVNQIFMVLRRRRNLENVKETLKTLHLVTRRKRMRKLQYNVIGRKFRQSQLTSKSLKSLIYHPTIP
eukprot:TCONS_00004351-protein